jgi:DNA modification methylase
VKRLLTELPEENSEGDRARPEAPTAQQRHELAKIAGLDAQLARHFDGKLQVHPSLTRQLVSFQANKAKARYRWYKYKEAFSASLVEYLLRHHGIRRGKLMDPFAGSGTALFAASTLAMDADGIELLPIGQEIISTRLCLDREFMADDYTTLSRWSASQPWRKSQVRRPLPTVRITDGAYAPATVEAIERYMGAWEDENDRVRAVLRFALLCVLESVSYTRKDGQFLRWDLRSGRRQGANPFHKGPILDFDKAVCAKINEIVLDARSGESEGLFPTVQTRGAVRLLPGSCLHVMPGVPDECYDVVLTSPPYCNRYDYTRTYALELALLGLSEEEILHLRQEMLTCTVESRAKDLLSINSLWADAVAAVEQEELLQAILRYLEEQKAERRLNNSGIPRMVRGYFYEMACVIFECWRTMKSDALLFMVNDNVRYAGASVSVDMILSHVAERLGFEVESILVLPNGKGNSSQQMGEHGRDPLRKCVYVWRKASRRCASPTANT